MMYYHSDLNFTKRLFQQMLLPTRMVGVYEIGKTKELDLGLRHLLLRKEKEMTSFEIDIQEMNKRTVYHIVDEYHCNYIFMRIPEETEDTCFFVGPYVTKEVPESFLLEVAERQNLKQEQVIQLRKYYSNLAIFREEGILFSIITTLGESIWGNTDDFSLEYREYKIRYEEPKIKVESNYQIDETLLTINRLEDIYALENELIQNVSQGKIYKIANIDMDSFKRGMKQRVADPIRNIKNYMIILNTILRKAAEYGAVHPLYLDRISSSYAKKIEGIHSIDAGFDMQKEMIHKYCLLVKNHSLKKYSLPVQKVITYIDFDLTADLGLKAIAKHFNINASYLSNLFKRETGQTLTDYVSQKRVQHAIYLLNSTNMQIQNIAHYCGVEDVNYFVKIFKKYIGKTPREYRNCVHCI